MRGERLNFAFLNVGHFLDHLFMLIFAAVAALRLTEEWGMSYAALIPYATPGFIAFGICALPAGWLADKWSREGMMVIFFVGIGASSIATALANTPFEIALGLLAIGAFAAIYHPVGLAMVVHGREKTGVPLAVNGVFGNLGVAAAALITGYFIDTGGWRNAFVLPGIISIGLGAIYAAVVWAGRGRRAAERMVEAGAPSATRGAASVERAVFVRLFSIIMLTTAIGGIIFQGTTFTLPKIFDERLTELAGSATAIGGYAFLVFSIAAIAQLYVGYLLDRHSARTVFAYVAGLQAVFFAVMYQLTGVAAPPRRHRLHARRIRADSDQRRTRRPDHEERVARPHVWHPFHPEFHGHGFHAAGHRGDPRELGFRHAVRGDGDRSGRHLRRGPDAAANRGDQGAAFVRVRLTAPRAT